MVANDTRRTGEEVQLMVMRIRSLVIVLTFAFAMSAVTAGSAFAAKGGRGGNGASSNSSLSLVLLDSTDGQAHWGQNVTFGISTTATATPYVDLLCYRGGVLVYSSTAGSFASYPWPW